MSQIIKYQTLCFPIPEGGEVILSLPDGIGPESLEAAHKCINLQMEAFKRFAGKKTNPMLDKVPSPLECGGVRMETPNVGG